MKINRLQAPKKQTQFKPNQTQYDWNPAPRPGTNARFDTGLIPPLKESEAGQLQIGTKRGKM
jgi:hypothetical protein